MRTIPLGYISVATKQQVFTHYPAQREIVLPAGTYTLKIDYPLNKVYKHTFDVSKKGISRRELINLICDHYTIIFVENENNDEDYGVWGHIINDLMLHTVFVSSKNHITIGVDS